MALAANDPAATPSPGGSAEATKATAEPGASPSVAEILTATEALEVSEQRIRRRLAAGTQIDALAVQIEAVERDFPKADRVLADASIDMLQFYDLLDLATVAQGSDRRRPPRPRRSWRGRRPLDADLVQLASSRRAIGRVARGGTGAQRTDRRRPGARVEKAIPRRSATLARQLKAVRDQVLQVLDRPTRLRREVRTLQAEASDRRAHLEGQMQSARAEPIWRIAERPGAMSRVQRFVRTEMILGVRHLRENAMRLLVIAVATFALSYGLIAPCVDGSPEAEPDPYTRQTVNLFQPWAAALLLSLLALVWSRRRVGDPPPGARLDDLDPGCAAGAGRARPGSLSCSTRWLSASSSPRCWAARRFASARQPSSSSPMRRGRHALAVDPRRGTPEQAMPTGHPGRSSGSPSHCRSLALAVAASISGGGCVAEAAQRRARLAGPGADPRLAGHRV
jgi:hypothetical protein